MGECEDFAEDEGEDPGKGRGVLVLRGRGSKVRACTYQVEARWVMRRAILLVTSARLSRAEAHGQLPHLDLSVDATSHKDVVDYRLDQLECKHSK